MLYMQLIKAFNPNKNIYYSLVYFKQQKNISRLKIDFRCFFNVLKLILFRCQIKLQ